MTEKLETGAIVGDRFRLESLLGEGGMGCVWAATHTVTRRRMALKFLKTRGNAGLETRQRFVREARTACAVEHPNILPIHDVFELEGHGPVMVMDRLRGETLRDVLTRERSLSLAQTATILLPVISAVGTAHSRGIVHRDLKPENLFLVDKGRSSPHIMVLDFGIAKVVALEGDDVAWTDTLEAGANTSTGALLGSPCYMAPEQAAGEVGIDHRVDIWALGIIIYETLSGILPIDGPNVGQVFKKLITGTIEPLENVCEDLPKNVYSLVGQMLQWDKQQRPDDLRRATIVLRQYANRDKASFRPPPATPRRAGTDGQLADTYPVDPETTKGDTVDGTSLAPPGEKGSPSRRLVFGLLVLALVGIVVWQLSSGSAPHSIDEPANTSSSKVTHDRSSVGPASGPTVRATLTATTTPAPAVNDSTASVEQAAPKPLSSSSIPTKALTPTPSRTAADVPPKTMLGDAGPPKPTAPKPASCSQPVETTSAATKPNHGGIATDVNYDP